MNRRKLKLAILLILLILFIIGIYMYFSFNINNNDTVFIDMKIPEGYIEKENLTVSEWKHGLYYLKLFYPDDISDYINEDTINDGLDKLEVNKGVGKSNLRYFKKIEQEDVIKDLIYNYEDYPEIYDNNIHDILEELKTYTFRCYGYSDTSVVSYYLYDLNNHVLHLIRILE